MNELTRRTWLSFAGGAVGASALAGRLGSPEGTSTQAASVDAGSSEEAWAYRRLDPTEAGQRAYAIYADGGCMYALFGGILQCLSRDAGDVFSSFPLHMMKYGAGGAGGWGTLCGALNGAAAAIGLFVADKKHREELINELFSWYESEPLPKFRPSTTGAEPREVAAAAAQSVLCHVSVVKWRQASGGKAEGKEKTERCRRLTADVCRKTVELLNRRLLAGKTMANGDPMEQGPAKARPVPSPPGVMGKMRCETCHSPEENNGRLGALFEK